MHYTDNMKEEWQAKFSTIKKLKILITVTDTEKVRLPSESFCALFSQFQLLEESQSEFDQFLVTVRIELMTKTDELKKLKMNMNASRTDRSCALVNLFMLSQYTTRMNKFEDICRKSLENICRKHRDGEEVDGYVIKHLSVLVKMKRRMKQMLDVSEKCVVVEMIDTANELKDWLEDAKDIRTIDEKEPRLSKSTLSLEAELDEERPRPRNSVSECLSSSIEACPATTRQRRTFKTISEHVIVITKSFTAKQ